MPASFLGASVWSRAHGLRFAPGSHFVALAVAVAVAVAVAAMSLAQYQTRENAWRPGGRRTGRAAFFDRTRMSYRK
ncbi:hypothetical protein, partial [Lysobacter sp. 22409]|uniref:hypothetical protein n=1 Tax=Lysobacter sp. 22409 TaxID=3453917 RepID=UPI003F86AC56